MSRYRDVKTVTVFTESWTGVQDVEVNFDAESFTYSGDDNDDLRRVDITKRKITFTINVTDPNHKRDISNPVYGTSPQVSLNEVLRITARQSCDIIEDSAEDDSWITYIGVTKKQTEAEVELRDVSQIMTAATIKVSDKDTLAFRSLIGASGSGLANSAYEEFTLYNLVVTGISPSLKHADLASGTINFLGHGDDTYDAKIFNSLSAGGSTVFEAAYCGATGTVSFIAPSVSGSGGDVTVTISNVVCTGVEIVANHGGYLERRFNFEAYSSDGSTSPVALT